MDDRAERAGLIGVGFLFGFISLFLLVACLKATGHTRLAAECGLGGSAVLAVSAGGFLLNKWRQAPDLVAFDEDGDVPFCGAVFLLAIIALGGGLILASGIPFNRAAPLGLLFFSAVAIPARRFVRIARPRR